MKPTTATGTAPSTPHPSSTSCLPALKAATCTRRSTILPPTQCERMICSVVCDDADFAFCNDDAPPQVHRHGALDQHEQRIGGAARLRPPLPFLQHDRSACAPPINKLRKIRAMKQRTPLAFIHNPRVFVCMRNRATRTRRQSGTCTSICTDDGKLDATACSAGTSRHITFFCASASALRP